MKDEMVISFLIGWFTEKLELKSFIVDSKALYWISDPTSESPKVFTSPDFWDRLKFLKNLGE